MLKIKRMLNSDEQRDLNPSKTWQNCHLGKKKSIFRKWILLPVTVNTAPCSIYRLQTCKEEREYIQVCVEKEIENLKEKNTTD